MRTMIYLLAVAQVMDQAVHSSHITHLFCVRLITVVLFDP